MVTFYNGINLPFEKNKESEAIGVFREIFGFGESILIGANEGKFGFSEALDFITTLVSNKEMWGNFVSSKTALTKDETIAIRKRIIKGKSWRGKPIKFTHWNENTKKWDIELPYEETYQHWVENPHYHSYMVEFRDIQIIKDDILPNFWNEN